MMFNAIWIRWMVSDKTSEFLKNSEVWLHNVGWTVEKFVEEEKEVKKKEGSGEESHAQEKANGEGKNICKEKCT